MVTLKGRSFLLLTVLAVALAGCANNGDPQDDAPGDVTPPPATSPEEARGLLEQASAGVPDKVGARASITKGSRTLMTLNGTFDNATGTGLIQVRGDAQALGGMGGAGASGLAAFSGAFEQGFTIYVSDEGSLYLANGTALTFPPGNATGQQGLGVPSPRESPFGSFLEPTQVLGSLTEAGVTVKSVNSTVYRGKPALQVSLTTAEDNATDTVVFLFTDPARVARIEGTAPRSPQSAADPLAGATFAVDFHYDEEAVLEVPEAVSRALGLSHGSDQPMMGGASSQPRTWTFQADGGIPLDEVEAQVKDLAAADASDPAGFAKQPTLWSMRLSEGNKTEGEATLTFTDADGDGMVSKGDTLRYVAGEGGATTVVLYDTKTGTHVVPGAGLLLALAGLGAVALLLRRR